MSKKQIIVIEKANINDLDNIYEFVCLLENQSFNKEVFRKIFVKNISNENNIYLIVRIENTSIGYISCHCQYLLHHCSLVGEIQEMFITENFRNLGIGQNLINTLKTYLLKKGVNQLEVTSNLKREETKGFYKKAGFEFTHRKFVSNLK